MPIRRKQLQKTLKTPVNQKIKILSDFISNKKSG